MRQRVRLPLTMNASSSNAAPSSLAMTPKFIEDLARVRQLKAALAELPEG